MRIKFFTCYFALLLLLSACVPSQTNREVSQPGAYKYTVEQLRPQGGSDKWQTNEWIVSYGTGVRFTDERGKEIFLSHYWRAIQN